MAAARVEAEAALVGFRRLGIVPESARAERLLAALDEGHIDRILGKLGFHSRTQLAVWVGPTVSDESKDN